MSKLKMSNNLKRAYHLLHNELDRLREENLGVEHLYALDKDSGEYVPVIESYDEEADKVLHVLRKKNSKALSFVMLHQEAQLYLCRNLGGNEIKMLYFVISQLKYDNMAYGLTQRDIATELNMSTRTVNRASKELINSGVLIITGKKGNRIYHVNPAFVWKGSFQRMKYKLSMFNDKMKDDDDPWRKPIN
jgi:CRP-like cAMP-binding protein